MRVGINIEGLDQAMRALERAGEDVAEVMTDTIEDTVLKAHQYAVQGIQHGPASGRTYQKYKPRRTHKASAPGQYPMSDTGRLASMVEFELPQPGSNRPRGAVGTALYYGPDLEFGTSRMASRPWLMPSVERAAAEISRELIARLEGWL